MAKFIATDLDFNSASKILNLPAPTLGGHAATKTYVDSLIEGLAWKDNVAVATQANLNIASPGGTIDTVVMALNDRVLVRANTSDIENGIYIWNGAAVAMTRSSDADSKTELRGTVVTVNPVDGGTSAGVTYRITTNPTPGTDPINFAVFGSTSGAASETSAGIAELATQAETDAGTDDLRIVTPLKFKTASFIMRNYTTTVGDGAATSYVITHGLTAGKHHHVTVYRTAAPFDDISCDVEHTSNTTVTLKFAVAPSAGQFTVSIIG